MKRNASAIVAPALKNKNVLRGKTEENLESHLGTIAQQAQYKSLLHCIP